jgi:hypothetical protein
VRGVATGPTSTASECQELEPGTCKLASGFKALKILRLFDMAIIFGRRPEHLNVIVV